ncbi:MAG: hypothetical protein ACK6CU_21260 [Deltaproteobacteria bacterium]
MATKKSSSQASAKKASPKKASLKKASPKKASPKKASPKKAPAPKAPDEKARPKTTSASSTSAAKATPSPGDAKKARIASRLAEDAARKIRREPRAYIDGSTTTDVFAEELGEDAVRAITSGQDEEADLDLVSGNRGEGLHVVE